MNTRTFINLLFVLAAGVIGISGAEYSLGILEDKPVGYWSMTGRPDGKIENRGTLGTEAEGLVVGAVNFDRPGPRPPVFPDFAQDNVAAKFGAGDGFIRIRSTSKNALAFRKGETITIEAWVSPRDINQGQEAYIVGKGRTQNPGFASENQNWALRLRGQNGRAHLSFLFRDERNIPASKDSWHRWISTASLNLNSGWHHIAVSYTFGEGDSLSGWIDAKQTQGKWDYGGKTDLGPVVDEDEVWIGSSQGGASGSTFNGLIDEVAIYRGALSPGLWARHVNVHSPAPAALPLTILRAPPTDAVRVEILEHSGEGDAPPEFASVGADAADTDAPPPIVLPGWEDLPGVVVEEFTQPALGLAALPTKYSNKGIKIDRPAPFLVRASTRIALPAGEYRLLLRAHSAARLAIDGKLIATTPFSNNKHADAEEVPDQAAKSIDGVRVLPPGHNDQIAPFQSDGLPHSFVFEAFVGGRKLRPEIGETCVAIASKNGEFHLLAPALEIPLTDEGWEPYAATHRFEMAERDVAQRRIVSSEEDKYWLRRHERARETISASSAPAVPPAAAGFPANNAIDHFINQKLAEAKLAPSPLLDDFSFLRRATLDTLGLIPTPEQIAEFQNDTADARRAQAIDKLLANPGWADHWVSYWQDVLAENPGMLKPTLNNTGPFRWFLYDSFRDNKPMDRFVTELIGMEGSLHSGGAAGFSMASENDVPMAAKAHIVAKAFLGMDLQCARCHDAPYQPFRQEELFSLAAMLKRAPEKVPLTSSIPTNSNITIGRLVEVTLAPGSIVKPAWPFTNVVDRSELGESVRRAGDTREELAALMTSPHNERFPRVIVNRVWKRYLGWGLVEPVDEWPTNPKISHPELLDWLARELVVSGYDLKHVARLVLNSQTYQRAALKSSIEVPKTEERLFSAPARRRLSAEQVVDSLFAAAGMPMAPEELNQDADGRRPVQDFNNLGIPKRAWEFCSLGNERDRPALALPRAQAIVDTLMMFGWRESRPNPITVRDDSPNVLQPANLANSTLAVRVVRLSEKSALTRLALESRPLKDLVLSAFLRVLSRPPTVEELNLFSGYLEPGYADRRVAVTPAEKKQGSTQAVSWSNHLNAEATKIKLDLEREARAGEPPTPELRGPWRERMEDMVWAMVNSPEFIFVP